VATFASFAGGLDRDHARRIGQIADYVCGVWEQPDAGIWELRGEPRHYTQSKMMCAVALTRACEIAAKGVIPAKGAEHWRREETRIREFVERNCYSEAKASYTRSAGEEELDAALLLGVIAGYDDARSQRLVGTVDAVRRDLGNGALVHRWAGEPAAFLACSFWLADAYARQGRLDEARALLEELVGLANDLGLYSEELEPATGDFLGNFPQGLTHLGLINAAASLTRAERGEL